MSQVAHPAGTYPGFHGLKQQEVSLLPPGWDVSPSQGYPPTCHEASLIIRWYPFLLLGREKHCEIKVFSPTTQ